MFIIFVIYSLKQNLLHYSFDQKVTTKCSFPCSLQKNLSFRMTHVTASFHFNENRKFSYGFYICNWILFFQETRPNATYNIKYVNLLTAEIASPIEHTDIWKCGPLWTLVYLTDYWKAVSSIRNKAQKVTLYRWRSVQSQNLCQGRTAYYTNFI